MHDRGYNQACDDWEKYHDQEIERVHQQALRYSKEAQENLVVYCDKPKLSEEKVVKIIKDYGKEKYGFNIYEHHARPLAQDICNALWEERDESL